MRLSAPAGVSEAEMHARTLRALLLLAAPGWVSGPGARGVALFGSSNGGRCSAFFAGVVAPEMAAALVLNNVTAGPRAAQVLSHEYYTQARSALPPS